ncbi:TIGR04222 domain-containing membrane protein [Streptomyces antimicrobicus]|uniref:TIGR04222 domain-containing membrane protein n=1 Tax=Streptomyces antimicrobicus TaxID=2883108 RepID=A0ABS8BFV8_9ACTN|nr:TIGR04222 domain-containing membrane protein [Streptomyces antimicrobicus]MCB5183510.1 TIGR04222 domain-containing membrane protein [Streptomyces antimicrobicus]
MTVLAVLVWVAVLVSSVGLARAVTGTRPGVSVWAPQVHDLSEAAFLAGGPGRVVDTALVSLHSDGRMIIGGPGIVQFRPGARAVEPAELAVAHACLAAPSGGLGQVRHDAMRHPAVQEIGDALAARGLLAPAGSGGRRRRGQRWGAVQAGLCVAAIPLSILATFVELAVRDGSGVPFVFLVTPALVVGIVLGTRYAARARSRTTPAGRQALAGVRAFHRADRAPHVRTALYGPRAVEDPVLRAHLVAAGRSGPGTGPGRGPGSGSSSGGDDGAADAVPVVWCAGVDGSGPSGCGSTSGHACGAGGRSGGSSCGGAGGSGCASAGSGCASSPSSCGGSSGSSCGSSSSSSCGGSSSS